MFEIQKKSNSRSKTHDLKHILSNILFSVALIVIVLLNTTCSMLLSMFGEEEAVVASDPVIALVAPANNAQDQETTVLLSWNAIPGSSVAPKNRSTLSLFRVYFTEVGSVYPAPEIPSPQNSKSMQKTGLKENTAYKWKVEVQQTDGKSVVSEEWKFTTKDLVLQIPDSNLEQAIRAANGYTGQLTGAIYQRYVSGITTLSAYGRSITNIEGIQSLVNLKWLDLGWNAITNISALQTLTNLEWLDFSRNQVANILSVQNLVKLTGLRFTDNLVTDLTPLQNLIILTELDFGWNQVTEITSLQNLTLLKILKITDNQVTDITALQNLINLTQLDFRSNRVNEIQPLQNLVYLKELDFSDNQVMDISPLQNLKELTVLSFGRNRVMEVSALQNLTGLRNLWFAYNLVKDVSALVNNTGLGVGDSISMRNNFLDSTPGSQSMLDIQALISRGAIVFYDSQRLP